MLGGREAFESPAHFSLLRALSPQQNLKNRKPGRIKASQRMLQAYQKKGRFAVGSVGWHSNLFIFLKSQLDVHSPITGSVLRIERYLLTRPPHFLPVRAYLQVLSHPLLCSGLRYIRICSPGDGRQNRLPFPLEPFSYLRECLTVSTRWSRTRLLLAPPCPIHFPLLETGIWCSGKRDKHQFWLDLPVQGWIAPKLRFRFCSAGIVFCATCGSYCP